MAIRITNPVDSFDHIFLGELLISQDRKTLASLSPVYNISYTYRFYKIVDDEIIYKDGSYSGSLENYYGAALADYGLGDATLMNALLANQAAVSKLINDTTTIITETY